MSKITNFQTIVKSITLTVPADTYAGGDVLADSQQVTILSAVPPQGMRGSIIYTQLLDQDDNSFNTDIVYFDSNVSLGTEGSAVSITDSNAEKILGVVRFASSWKDLTNSQVNSVNHNPIPFNISNSGDLYVGAIIREIGTVGVADKLYLTVGFVIDSIAIS